MHRRQFLGLVGGIGLVATAGCSSVRDGDDSSPSLDPDEVAALVSEPPPRLTRPAPVQPAAAAVESALDRGDSFLEAVPDPLPRETVPGDELRGKLGERRERARLAREEVEAAPDEFRALWETGRFRRRARTVGAAYEAVDTDIRGEIEDERTEVERAVGTELAQVPYTGEGLERTLLLATRLEESLTGVQRALARSYERTEGEPEPLRTGRLAGDAEFGRAVTDAVSHLAERHGRMVQEPGEFTQAFDAALARAEGRLLESRVVESPEELVESATDRRGVFYLVDSVLVGPQDLRDFQDRVQRRQLATSLDTALELETRSRALDSILSRLDEGGFPPPETVDRVREEREAALAAVAEVDIDPATRSLAADRYVRTVQRAHRIDENLLERVERGREENRNVDPSLCYAGYARLRARLVALPDAVDAFQGWFDRD